MPKTCFIIYFNCPNNHNEIVGVYSTQKGAEEAIEILKLQDKDAGHTISYGILERSFNAKLKYCNYIKFVIKNWKNGLFGSRVRNPQNPYIDDECYIDKMGFVEEPTYEYDEANDVITFTMHRGYYDSVIRDLDLDDQRKTILSYSVTLAGRDVHKP